MRDSSGSAVAGAMPHTSKPSVRACALTADEVSMTRHPMAGSQGGSSEELPYRRVRRTELQLCRKGGYDARDTSCRSTYGRIPPCRNAASSSGVSMRHTASNRRVVPSSAVATTVTRPRAASAAPAPSKS